MNNNNTIAINKNNLDAIGTQIKIIYARNCYYEALRIYADKYDIMQNMVDEWMDKEFYNYTKYNTMELTLSYLNIKELVSKTEKETICKKAMMRAIKKLGLEEKESRL